MQRIFIVLLATACGAAYPRDSYAYIDPGTGSFLLQILVSGFLTGVVAIKLFWRTIKTRVAALFGKNPTEPT